MCCALSLHPYSGVFIFYSIQYLPRRHKFNSPPCVPTAENNTLEFGPFASHELVSTLRKGGLEWSSPNISNQIFIPIYKK